MSILSRESIVLSILDIDDLIWTDYSDRAVIAWPDEIPVTYVNWRLESGIVGEAYDCSFVLADWNDPTYFTKILGDIPDGLELESLPNNTCRIHGTPTTPGFFTFTIRGTNADGAGNKEVSIHVLNAVGGTGTASGFCLSF